MSAEDVDRYMAAMHAVQTGVAYQMEVTKECEPKHLRVGVNSAMVTERAVATLLMEKGIVTLDEYEKALADAAVMEAADYQERVRRQFGNDNITLA